MVLVKHSRERDRPSFAFHNRLLFSIHTGGGIFVLLVLLAIQTGTNDPVRDLNDAIMSKKNSAWAFQREELWRNKASYWSRYHQ